MRAKRVILLGATGSIGDSALKVAGELPGRMRIAGIAARRNAAKLAAAANRFRPEAVCLVEPEGLPVLRAALGYSPRILTGEEGLVEIASGIPADLVLVAIVGTGGLRPALAAIEAGRDLAVASKEILVMAGETVMGAARRRGVQILPVDSEHNAIFQCLEGRDPASVRRLILTASGGPFRAAPSSVLASVTPAAALRHPTWEMGRKITIDSATLFNKGLEMIEARWLFDVPIDRVDVVVHPQSIVHSMVEFVDGSILAQLGGTDMRHPIQFAVTWPERVPSTRPALDLGRIGRLEFEEPRHADFPALGLARRAAEVGGTMPAVFNAANEIAVDKFLEGDLTFPGIWAAVAQTMEAHRAIPHAGLDEILAADAWARERAGLMSYPSLAQKG